MFMIIYEFIIRSFIIIQLFITYLSSIHLSIHFLYILVVLVAHVIL